MTGFSQPQDNGFGAVDRVAVGDRLQGSGSQRDQEKGNCADAGVCSVVNQIGVI